MTSLYDSQKIRLGLQDQLNDANKALAEVNTVEGHVSVASRIRWLTQKLSFYSGTHRKYDEDNGQVQS